MSLVAIKRDEPLVELSEQYDVHANKIIQWKNRLLERASDAFEGMGSNALPHRFENASRQDLGADAGEQFFKRCVHQGQPDEGNKMNTP